MAAAFVVHAARARRAREGIVGRDHPVLRTTQVEKRRGRRLLDAPVNDLIPMGGDHVLGQVGSATDLLQRGPAEITDAAAALVSMSRWKPSGW